MTSAQNSSWVCWTIIRKDGVCYIYRNGILDNSGTLAGNVSYNTNLNSGFNSAYNTMAYFNLKAMRIYNRAVSNGEISALASEFTV